MADKRSFIYRMSSLCLEKYLLVIYTATMMHSDTHKRYIGHLT